MTADAHSFENPTLASDGEQLADGSDRNVDRRVHSFQYALSGGLFDVIPPAGLFEIPGLRTWFDGTFLSIVRLSATVVAPASRGTKLILQSSSNGSNWAAVAEVGIDTAGLHTGLASEMPDGELQLRLVTSGGDGAMHATIGVVTIREGNRVG